MSVSEEVAALRADLEKVQREKETEKREKEATQAELDRVQLEKEASDVENREYGMRVLRERSLGTSFGERGGSGSADRRGTAASPLGSMWTRWVSTGSGLGQSLPYAPRSTVPKFPMECPPYVYIAWERRFNIFITNQGLGHTISPDAPPITVINCADDAYLFGHFGEAIVTEHRRTWGYICEATAGAPFENRLYECLSVSDALRTMREWALPLQPAERHLLAAELEGVQFMGDEDPNFFFERISRLKTMMRAVGVAKSNSEIIQIILRQLPERYDVVKTMSLADLQTTRPRLENTIRSACSQRKAHEIAKLGPAAGTPAGPPNYAWGGHSSHVFIWSGAYFGDCGDIFPRRGYSRRGFSDVYFVGSGDIVTRRGFSRRDTGGVSSSAWEGAFLPCLHLKRR